MVGKRNKNNSRHRKNEKLCGEINKNFITVRNIIKRLESKGKIENKIDRRRKKLLYSGEERFVVRKIKGDGKMSVLSESKINVCLSNFSDRSIL